MEYWVIKAKDPFLKDRIPLDPSFHDSSIPMFYNVFKLLFFFADI